MKKWILSIVLQLTVYCAYSQTLPEFAPIGATWYYYNETSIVGNSFNTEKFISISTDTMEGKLCKQIKDEIFNSSSYFYADSLHLYFLNLNNEKWTLAGDFSKAVGDSFYVDAGYVAGDSFSVHILSKGDTIINGYKLPYIITDYQHINSFNYWYYGGKIIQNIGSDIYLLPFGGADGPGGPLNCYVDENLGTYKNPAFHNGTWPCDTTAPFISGLPFMNGEHYFYVYPNPTQDELTIETLNSATPRQIDITDALGRTTFQTSNVKPATQLDVHLFTPGIYFVKVQMSDGSLKVRKFVKE